MELDQFMKELVGDFLKEIIELFFPGLAKKLDFSKKKDLNKELYTESPNSFALCLSTQLLQVALTSTRQTTGEERFVDVLLEVGYRTPSPSVLLVHVESQ